MDTERLDALFDRHLDGALSADEEAELAALLTDAEARRRWRTLAALEGKLLEAHLAAPAALPARGFFAARRRRPGDRRAPVGPIAAAAALATAGILLVLVRPRPATVSPPVVARPAASETAEARTEPRIETPPPPAEPAPHPVAPETPAPKPPDRPGEPPPPLAETPPAEEPVPPPPKDPPGETVAAVALLERIEGRSFLRPGQGILPGQEIETSPREGLAVLRYPDGTLLEAGPGTLLRGISGDPQRLTLDRGTLAAKVSRQPAGRPLVVETPHAEARVLGTTLRLDVNADRTRLEVDEGRVRLIRKSDGKFLDVPTGHYAVAAQGADFAVRPLPPRLAVLSFTLVDADTGKPVAGFDPIPEGAVLRLSRLPSRRLNIRANVAPAKVGSVLFGLDGNPTHRVENGLSGTLYSLAGDVNGKYNAWTPPPGVHKVTATPYTEPNAGGSAGTPLTLTFRVAKD